MNFGRLKLLVQEKETRNVTKIIKEELFASVDKLLEYECTSTKQHSTQIELFV